MALSLPFDNSYAKLPERFYARLAPTPVRAPGLVKVNAALAETLGLDPALLASEAGVAALAGNAPPEGSEPLAMAYAGHQFGGWVPQLGDGRAILLGEIVGTDGVRRDIQLKGAGRTPFSRQGDGRAALGPVLREYIVSEAMAALGAPTTRALAAVVTGEPVYRETALPGAVLTRVAASHLRVGTFQFFSARQDVEGLERLADYALARHDPELAADLAQAPRAERARALLERVVARQADLVAHWMAVGFIHGVMNTDNMTISGETIDYGPCAFMDRYDPETVFSSIDQFGRYAYRNQPGIAHWNLAQLAAALLPLLADAEDAAIETAQAAIDAYPRLYDAAHLARFRAKLGFSSERAKSDATDAALIVEFLKALDEDGADFTLSFRALAEQTAGMEPDGGAVALWSEGWRARLASEADAARGQEHALEPSIERMRAANPARIPRNHRVERAIAAAVMDGDFAPFEALLEAGAAPYATDPRFAAEEIPPRPEERVRATFCGT